MKQSLLQVRGVVKKYGESDTVQKALNGISFNVCKGEFVGIMGPSGSGKTTLLNCISTIDNITEGEMILNGNSISDLKGTRLDRFRSEELGFIFQDFKLLATLTAYENIALALTIQGCKKELIEKRVVEVAKLLSIQELLQKVPLEMSGGQKQRVAAARAIVTNPSLVLADEPTGALDSKAARLLLKSLDALNKNINTTILMVTHDAFAASYTERILFIKDGCIFQELLKGNDEQEVFYKKIVEVTSVIGGDNQNVF